MRWLIPLCVFYLVACAPSVTYYYGEYEQGLEERKSLFFETIFDSNLLLNPTTSSWFAGCQASSGASEILACCPSGSEPGCTTPCLDTVAPLKVTTPVSTAVGLGTGFTSFYFQFKDAACSAAFISVVPVTGVLYMDAWTGDPSSRTYLGSISNGSLVICCSKLVEFPAGVFQVNVDVMGFVHSNPSVNATANVTIFQDANNLRVADFPDLVETDINFDFGPTVSCASRGSSVCVQPFFATNDTIYDYYKRAADIRPLTFTPNLYFIELIVERSLPYLTKPIQEFSWDALGFETNSRPVIKLTYRNVANLPGQFTALQVVLPCNYQNTKGSEILAAKSAFSTVDSIAVGQNITGRFAQTFYKDVVGWALRRYAAPFASKGWIGCRYYIESALATKAESGTVSITTYVCNQSSSQQLCCIPSTTTVRQYARTPRNATVLASQCSALTCVKSSIEKYFDALAGADRCASSTTLVPDTTSSIYQDCLNYLIPKPCTTDVECSIAYPKTGAICRVRQGVSVYQYAGRIRRTALDGQTTSGLRICVPLCTQDSDCVYGTCYDKGSWGECVMNSTVDPYVEPNMAKTLSTCFAQAIEKISSRESFFKTRVAQVLEIEGSPTPAQIAQALVTKTSSATCPLHILAGRSLPPSCSVPFAKTCNSVFCANNFINPICNNTVVCPATDFCARTLPLSPIVKQRVSQNGDCIVFPLLPPASAECGYYRSPLGLTIGDTNGVWDSVNEYCIFKQLPGTTTPVGETDCLNSKFCTAETIIPLSDYRGVSYRDLAPYPANGTVCLPVCIDTTVTNRNACNPPNRWNPTTTACEVPALNKADCGVTTSTTRDWWAGSVWLPPLNNPSLPGGCSSKCIYSAQSTTQADCSNGFHCSIPCEGCGQSGCEAAGFCSMEPGCYFNFKTSNPGECDVAAITGRFANTLFPSAAIQDAIQWTPRGCMLKFEWGLPINQVTCEAKGGTYLSYTAWKSLTKTTCENITLCSLGSSTTRTTLPPKQRIWPGYSYDNTPSSCARCGGSLVPGFKWITGKWIQNTDLDWLQLNSQPFQDTNLYTQPATTITESDFLRVVGLADALRELDYAKSRADCVANTFSTLPAIACLCRGDNQTNITASECNCDDDPNGPQICAPITVCGSILKGSLSCSGFSSYQLENTTWPSNKCESIQAYDWARSYLEPSSKPQADSGRIFSTQIRRGDPGYIKNSNNIIVGQVVGAGSNVNFASGTGTGFYACINFTDIEKRDSSLKLAKRDIGEARLIVDSNNDTALGPIMFLGLDLPIGTQQQCVPVKQGYAYFPLELVDGANTLTYPQTLKDPASAIFAVGFVVYGIGILVLILLLVVDIQKKAGNTTYVKPALLFLGTGFALRMAWIGYLLSDPQNERITVLFIELPAMLYWFLASFNLTRWIRPQKGYGDEDSGCSHTCCLPKLKQFVLVIVSITVIMFIIMLVFILGNLGSSTSGSAGSAISGEQQIAEFAWFSFYVTFVFIEIIWFLLSILCGLCGAGMALFEPAEEGNNTASGMTCSVILSMITVIAVSIAQTILIVRVFLWSPFPGLEWDAPTAIGYTLLLDIVPAILLIVCAVLSPYRRGTLFEKQDNC